MEAIILAGGLGTRLQETVPNLPKAMAPVGDRPFLSHLLAYLQTQGVTKAILAVGYMAEKVEAYFGESHNGLPIIYSNEPRPMGTGGAIKLATAHVSTWPVLAVNGDTLFPFSLPSFEAFHHSTPGCFSIALCPMSNCERYGTVVTSPDGQVLKFEEKRPSKRIGLINAGAYLLDESSRLLIPSGASSLEQDVIPALSMRGLIYGVPFSVPFLDIGVPEDYRSFCNTHARQ